MAKTPNQIDVAMREPPKKAQKQSGEIELEPDAWDRFRQAVHDMTKAGPQHRIGDGAVKSAAKPSSKAKERPASKGRVYKGKSRT